jgi:hypothetical protein
VDPVKLSIAFVVMMNQAYGPRLEQNIRILPLKQNDFLAFVVRDRTIVFEAVQAVFRVLGATPI